MDGSPHFGDAGLCRDSSGEEQFADDRLPVDCGAQSGLGTLGHSCRPASIGPSLQSVAWWYRKKSCAWVLGLLDVSNRKQQLHEAVDYEIFPVVGFGQRSFI